jgi:hypothetical protein
MQADRDSESDRPPAPRQAARASGPAPPGRAGSPSRMGPLALTAVQRIFAKLSLGKESTLIRAFCQAGGPGDRDGSSPSSAKWGVHTYAEIQQNMQNLNMSLFCILQMALHFFLHILHIVLHILLHILHI